jgi:hypothetical protein
MLHFVSIHLTVSIFGAASGQRNVISRTILGPGRMQPFKMIEVPKSATPTPATPGLAIALGNAIKSIMADAGKTFAGIFAFLAPEMGPAAAGPAAAGMGAVEAVTAMVPALAVGTPWVMKTGLAMIHQGEAVVPAQVNQAWQGGGGGDTHVHAHFNISAMDGHSVAQFFKNESNIRTVARNLSNHLRNNPTMRPNY